MKHLLLTLLVVYFVVSWDKPEVYYGTDYGGQDHVVYLEHEGPPKKWQVVIKRESVRADTLAEAEKAATCIGDPYFRKALNVTITKVEEKELK